MSKFEKLKKKLSMQSGITNPGGLAYKIGKRKYGKKAMTTAAKKGVSAASVAKKK